MKTILTIILAGFVIFCGVLVLESGLFENPSQDQAGCILLQQTDTEEPTAIAPAEDNPQLHSAETSGFYAPPAPPSTIIIGAKDPWTENADTGFKFQLKLSSKGAAIQKATFSNGPDRQGRPTGFNNRDPKEPKPLEFLSPAGNNLSMANNEFLFFNRGLLLRLNNLHWKTSGVQRNRGGGEKVQFEAVIKDKETGQAIIKLSKTYTVRPESYDVDCSLIVENMDETDQKVGFNMAGPLGTPREGFRRDQRKIVGGFRNSENEVTTDRIKLDDLKDAKTIEDRTLQQNGDRFLWAAAANKYFAAILVPLPDNQQTFCKWVASKTGRFYNPDGDIEAESGDETFGVNLETKPVNLSPAGSADSSKSYNFLLYLGPKDKTLFDTNELYKKLAFFQTIDFLACCCPASIISPLAFGILAIMNWMYSFIGNYGIVIIILVFLIRVCIHPLTKKSQVSMSKFSKLAPKMEEIKKKYADNKKEMNKQIMALYKEHGASPITGMLPMFVQMPIWISLYSAIYASIELRGAAFLPVWITDLSVPDALFSFPAINLPIFGVLDSFNLLPLLMGVAFYLQQKLMPARSSGNSQAAQQQKMMMVMMPIIFPLILYKAPSGLNLYIMSSVSAGAIEQYIIRKHIREKEENESKGLVSVTSKTGGKVKKKKPKPFFKDH